MLVAAALVPDTALVVPGVAGSADPARTLRAAARDAVRDATADVERVVVVAPGPVDRELTGPVRGTFAAVGVPDRALRGTVPVVLGAPDGASSGLATSAGTPAPGTAAAIHLLVAAGRESARLVEVSAGRADRLRALGRALAAVGGPERVALVVVGSASGRHGPDAPLADDDRAPENDARLLADLSDAGPAARARLAAADAALAAELAVTGWAPWQVLLGAVGDARAVDAKLLHEEVLAGAQHAVLLWRCT
jgi:hypothetical protein